jgi:hypothetical protein
MALPANTIERIRTEENIIAYPFNRLHEVVLTGTPRDVTVENRGSQALLIVRFEDQLTASAWGVDGLVGTVRMVGPSYSTQNGWLYYRENGQVTRVFGAPLNPEPVNGHHYRLIDGGHPGYLLRYNDDDHRDERGRANLPWTIIETGYGDDRSIFGADGFSNNTITSPYVEVNYAPAEAEATPWAEPVEAPPETVGNPTVINHTETWLHGLAERNPGGDVTLNPEPVVGKMYLLREKATSDYTRLAMWTPDGFAISGLIDGYHDFTRDRGLPFGTRDQYDYVQFEMNQPTKVDDRAAVVHFKRLLHEEKVQYHGWQEALNELADEHDWCGEYESAVHRLGIMDRGLRRDDEVPAVPDIDENGDPIGEPEPTTLRRLFEFDVNYDATFELEQPSGRVDDALAYSINITLSTSSMRFDGNGSVRVGPISAEGTDLEDMEREARDSIDSAMVEEAITNNLSEADLIEVTDYNIDDDADDVTDQHNLEDYFDMD